METLNLNKESRPSAGDLNDFTIPIILKAIEQHLDVSEFKALLRGCITNVLVNWKDDNSLDLLHYCILHNNIVALIVLLNQGCFKPPYSPTTWPYLHMVACFGYTSLISTIVQETNFQNEGCILEWDIYEKCILPRTNVVASLIIDNIRDQKFTPVDVAAIFHHTECIELLLDFWQLQGIKSNHGLANRTKFSSAYLCMACKVNSPYALQLLLTKYSEKKEALESALRVSAPQCVDIVLREMDESAVKKVFQGMNLFHVLFSYSCCLTVQQYEAMVEITGILIKHKQDVNVIRPSRTFPLYSLLCHSSAGIRMEECAQFLNDSLLLLIQAGADPNVDEIMKEEESKDCEENTAFGRQPYSSAINCILGNIPNLKMNEFDSQTAPNPVDQYSYNCIKLLLKHGANLSHVGKFISYPDNSSLTLYKYDSGTSLHVMVSTRPLGQLSYSILRLLLLSGVNADACASWHMSSYDIDIQYALNILPLSLWSVPTSAHHNSRTHLHLTDEDLKSFIYIMKFMTQSSLVLAYREFLNAVGFLRSSDRGNDTSDELETVHLGENQMYLTVLKEYESATREPWPLQQFCSTVIWNSCKRQKKIVSTLPIPKPLKNIILYYH